MENIVMSERRIKPGVTISREVWEDFKKNYPENTSRKLEEMMKRAIEEKDMPTYFSASTGSSFSFEDPSSWNVKWSGSSLNVDSNYASNATNYTYVVRLNNNEEGDD